MKGALNKRICKKFAKTELDDVTRNPKDWIIGIELLRSYVRRLGFIIDDVEIMTHILTNLPEEYKNIFENLEEKLDDKNNMFTVERIRDNLSAKYNRMNARSNENEGK